MSDPDAYCLKCFLSSEALNFRLFDKIPKEKSEKNIQDFGWTLICSICLQKCDRPCHPNSCFHNFCESCLKQWSAYKRICPYCRQKFKKIYLIKLI